VGVALSRAERKIADRARPGAEPGAASGPMVRDATGGLERLGVGLRWRETHQEH